MNKEIKEALDNLDKELLVRLIAEKSSTDDVSSENLFCSVFYTDLMVSYDVNVIPELMKKVLDYGANPEKIKNIFKHFETDQYNLLFAAFIFNIFVQDGLFENFEGIKHPRITPQGRLLHDVLEKIDELANSVDYETKFYFSINEITIQEINTINHK